MFYSSEFIFDKIPGEVYGLKLVNFDTGKVRNELSNAYTIYEQKLSTRYKPIKIGASLEDKLSFDITIAREEPLDRYDRNIFYRWLFQKDYKELQIIQEDLEGVFFNCVLTAPREEVISGFSYGVTVTVTCDGPFAMSNVFSSTVLSDTSSVHIENLYIDSCVDEYIYPKLSINFSNTSTNTLRITNNNDKRFVLSDLPARCSLTVDNYFGIIYSNYNITINNLTSKNWLRLTPGNNQLRISTMSDDATGDFRMTITYRYPISI